MISDLLANQPFWAAVIAAVSAQTIKLLLGLVLDRRWEPTKLLETGGMPSSHTASVAALATAIGLLHGLDSPEFAIAAIVGSIVMYDAAGVRHAAGEQGLLLNQLTAALRHILEDFRPPAVRKLMGHTYVEVLAGLILGVVSAIILVVVWPAG